MTLFHLRKPRPPGSKISSRFKNVTVAIFMSLLYTFYFLVTLFLTADSTEGHTKYGRSVKGKHAHKTENSNIRKLGWLPTA